MTYRYVAFGLQFESEMELPELLPSVAPGQPDVTVRYGDVPEKLDDVRSEGVLFQVNTEQFLLRIGHIAGYLLTKGREIVIQPADGADERDVRVFLLSSVVGALLHQKGILALHGAAVEVGGAGMIIAGPSGVGKSTFAAALAKRGYRILADDISAVTRGEHGALQVEAALPRLKIWHDVAMDIGEDVNALAAVRSKLGKYYKPLNGAFRDRAIPLRALCVVGLTNTGRYDLNPVVGPQKMEVVVRNTFLARTLRGSGAMVAHFGLCAQLASDAAVFSLARPRGPLRVDEGVRVLLSGLRQ